jgi:thiamine-phosphate pyrophosphorylase
VARSGNSLLIINDDAAIALESGADGVHLGQKDMAVEDAREMLGKKAIIGGTANTCEEAVALSASGVDYIGLGPFRFTRTKQQLAPILGLDGLQSVVKALHIHQAALPVFAIGGITEADVIPILETGVYGIAVSSAINLSVDRKAAVVKMLVLASGFESAGVGHNIN